MFEKFDYDNQLGPLTRPLISSPSTDYGSSWIWMFNIGTDFQGTFKVAMGKIVPLWPFLYFPLNNTIH